MVPGVSSRLQSAQVKAGEALFFRKHVAEALDLLRAVRDSNHTLTPPEVISERYDGFQQTFRGGKIPLKPQRLAIGRLRRVTKFTTC